MNPYFLSSILFCMFLNVQNIAAQSVIESKYDNGQIQTRYHVRQKDTFCIESFRRNGVLESKSWHNDSIFTMESNQIIQKQYGQPQKAKGLSPILYLVGSSPDFQDFRDSILEYYPNGQYKSKSYYVHNKRSTYTSYLSNGDLDEIVQFTRNADNTFQQLRKKQDIEQIGLLDTAQQIYTLTFKQRNQIRQRNIYQWIPQKSYYDFPMITQIVYDSTENQMAVWHRDSVLHPDKNNNLCLYGMRNAADEWVIPPQYESITTIHYSDYNNIDQLNTYYLVNQGDKRGVINTKGEIVIPIEWDGLNDLRDRHAESKEPLFRDMLNWEQPYSKIRFVCIKNKLCGVINVFNEIILKPIYQEVNDFKNNLFEIEVGERHGIVDQSGRIIVEPNYYDLEFTDYDDLFIQRDTVFDPEEQQMVQKKGLINRFGKILLPCQFENIAEEDAYHRCFFTYLKEFQKQGVFHAERGWLMDTSIYIDGFYMRNPVKNYTLAYQKIKDSKRKTDTILFGVFAAPNADRLLPFEYQQIKCFEINKYHLNNEIVERYPYFLCQKNGKYGIFDPMRRVWKLPLKYDKLYFLGDSLFLGLAQGKWWAINGQQQSLLVESVDDIIFYDKNQAFDLYTFYIQKKDTLYRYDKQSFPYSASIGTGFYNNRTHVFFNGRGESLVANSEGRILVSAENHILLHGGDYQTITDSVKVDGVMVEQSWVFQEPNYFIVQNKKTKQQQIIDIQGNRKSFLSQYDIQSFQNHLDIALVADKKTGLLGMVTAHLDRNKVDGTVLLPCQFFGLTRPDARGIVWGKKDFPAFAEIKMGKTDSKPIIWGQMATTELPKNGVRTKLNTLSALDTRWQMHDKTGKLLSTVYFDYPFEWQNRLGIGQVAGKQGLWNAQGKAILPAKYDRIFYDEYSKMFHLFQFQADGQQQVCFANGDGQLITNDVFKNVSFFYSNWAFVETNEGYGMIQKNGQYLVKPAPFALQQSTISLIDTVLSVQKKDYNRLDILAPYEGMQDEQSPAAQQWATLVEQKQKIQVGNLMMEQVLPRYFINGQHIWWQRQNNLFFCKKNPFFILEEVVPSETVKRTKVIEVIATERWISLKLRASDYVKQEQKFHYSGGYPNKPFFKNLELKNNIWKEIGINDILIWNAATQKAVNQLLFDKIGALKNQQMDCGNPEKYWEKVQNQFFILFEGLQFYMPRSNDFEETIPILLTWAELKPYTL